MSKKIVVFHDSKGNIFSRQQGDVKIPEGSINVLTVDDVNEKMFVGLEEKDGVFVPVYQNIPINETVFLQQQIDALLGLVVDLMNPEKETETESAEQKEGGEIEGQ